MEVFAKRGLHHRNNYQENWRFGNELESKSNSENNCKRSKRKMMNILGQSLKSRAAKPSINILFIYFNERFIVVMLAFDFTSDMVAFRESCSY